MLLLWTSHRIYKTSHKIQILGKRKLKDMSRTYLSHINSFVKKKIEEETKGE